MYRLTRAIRSTMKVGTGPYNLVPRPPNLTTNTPLIPHTAPSDYDRKGASVSLSDAYTFSSGALFRMALNYTRFDSNAHGQGNEAMLLTPDGWGGNFFNSWARSSSQFHAAPCFHFPPPPFLTHPDITITANA